MITNQNSAAFDWVECVHLLKARWVTVVLIVSIVFLAGATMMVGSPESHRAEVVIEFFPRRSDHFAMRRSSEMQASSASQLGRETVRLKSRDLLAEVLKKTDLGDRWQISSPEDLDGLSEKIEVVRGAERNTLILSVTDPSSEAAADLANALASRFVSRETSDAVVRANQRATRLGAEVDSRRERVVELEKRLLELNLGPEAGTETVEETRRDLLLENNVLLALEARHQAALIDAEGNQKVAAVAVPADPSTAMKLGSSWSTAGSLISLGLLMGVATVCLFGREKGRLSVIKRMSEKLEIDVSGLAPVTGKSLMHRARPSSALIEPFRDVRTKIDRLPAGECLFLTMVPDEAGEGFAEVLVNLAAVQADAGHTVLVIDADMRDPRLHEYFDSAQHPGLSDFLTGEMRLEETVIKTRRANLWFMPSGPQRDDPSGLIAGRRMTDLVWEMRSRFDYIIVSSPSLLEFAEAGALSEIADHTVAVSAFREHSLSRLKKMKAAVELASGVFSGVVLTDDQTVDEPIEPVVQIKPTVSVKEPANAVDLSALQSTLVSRIRQSRQQDR